MWILYAVFIIMLALTVNFHTASHQETEGGRKLMQAAALILSLGVFGVAALWIRQPWGEAMSLKKASGLAIATPFVCAAYYAGSALLMKLSLPGKTNTLRERRTVAFVCWAIVAAGSLLLPAASVRLDVMKTTTSGEAEYDSITKSVSVFKLLSISGEYGGSVGSLFRTLIIIAFIALPIVCLAVNFVIPSRYYIWANICGMTAHCVSLALFSKLVSSSADFEELSETSGFGAFTIAKVVENDSFADKISDMAGNGYAPYDVSLNAGLGASIPLAAAIFLAAYLSVATFYYTYAKKEAVAYSA